MSILADIQLRFVPALAELVSDPKPLLSMIRIAQDAKFGDYQANFAMSLGKQLGMQPRDIALQVVAKANLSDLCETPEIAGPGFINLRLRTDWLAARVTAAAKDDRLGIPPVAKPRTIVVDFSSPNVAKPMHVGHIRSTVIGDSLYRLLQFLGHRTISDNHVGDWGTQFGMIIYGYKHFVDSAAYAANSVAELGRLYKLVRQLVDYHDNLRKLPELELRIGNREAELATLRAEPKPPEKGAAKKQAQAISKLEEAIKEQRSEAHSLREKIGKVENNPDLTALAGQHPSIGHEVLAETAKLHAGDADSLKLWNEFLPSCRDEIQRIYRRLNVRFDYEYGESFYHDRLGAVVADLEQKGLARESQGAICVFLDGFDAPMIVQKKDGAFLYATTDLATIQFRMQTWQPDAILYVVDHRQSDHFDKLFAAAKLWGYRDIELQHIKFGTVLGKDKKPYKTREGAAEGLDSLLDEAIQREAAVVAEIDDQKKPGPELSADERRNIAELVGIGAVKYADLSQNRTSDYEFSYDKMVQLDGNSNTYLQYSHARVRNIFRKANVSAESIRSMPGDISLAAPAERALALQLLRFAESLDTAAAEYMPHHIATYLFELSRSFSTFFEQCHVLRAESDDLRRSRLLLCDLTARTLAKGLELLGIQTVDRM